MMEETRLREDAVKQLGGCTRSSKYDIIPP